MAVTRAMTQHSPVAFSGPSTPTCSSCCCCCCVGSVIGTAVGLVVVGVRAVDLEKPPADERPAAQKQRRTRTVAGVAAGLGAALAAGSALYFGLAQLGPSYSLPISLVIAATLWFAISAAVATEHSVLPAIGVLVLGAVVAGIELVVGVMLFQIYPVVLIVVAGVLIAASVKIARSMSVA